MSDKPEQSDPHCRWL